MFAQRKNTTKNSNAPTPVHTPKKKFSKLIILICAFVMVVTIGRELFYRFNIWQDNQTIKEQQRQLNEEKQEASERELKEQENSETDKQKDGLDNNTELNSSNQNDLLRANQDTSPEILPEYQSLYEQNNDLVGWLTIPDTIIDYPVMQTMENEDYYLSHDFYGKKNVNGCLILDTDSNAGVGTRKQEPENSETETSKQPSQSTEPKPSKQSYSNIEAPSTNLTIHGHTMKSGLMFGNLHLYEEKEYGKDHSVIEFDSLYEHRKYQLIAVFYSQVYYANQDVFKYYQFFEAKDQSQFDDWYQNIKTMSLYDTGVEAEFGDEFITLSCCSYQVEDGRFVVVGKRIQ